MKANVNSTQEPSSRTSARGTHLLLKALKVVPLCKFRAALHQWRIWVQKDPRAVPPVAPDSSFYECSCRCICMPSTSINDETLMCSAGLLLACLRCPSLSDPPPCIHRGLQTEGSPPQLHARRYQSGGLLGPAQSPLCSCHLCPTGAA